MNTLGIAPWIALGFFISSGAQGHVPKGAPNIKPKWIRHTLGPGVVSTNSSFLDTSDPSLFQFDGFYQRIIDPATAKSVRQQYEAMRNTLEVRRMQGMDDPGSESNYLENNKRLRDETISHVRHYHLDMGRRKAFHSLKQNCTGGVACFVLMPAVIGGAMVAGAYHDNIFDITFFNLMRIAAQSDIPTRSGRFEMNSPYFNGTLNYLGQAPPDGNKNRDVNQERYRLYVSRSLPVFDLNTGFTYGSSSRSFAASIGRPITPRLSCVVDAVRPVTAQSPALAEQRVTFNYGVSF